MSTLLGEILAADRPGFNSLFESARHTFPGLEADVFLDHLRETVGPLVECAASVDQAAAAPVCQELYHISLELVGQELLGKKARMSALNRGWQELLPALAALLAKQPAETISVVTNGLHVIAGFGAQWELWLRVLKELASSIQDIDTLRRAGQLLAWRCGMAHLREGALEIGATLPAEMAGRILGVSTQQHGLGHKLLQYLKEDPWLSPLAAVELCAGNSPKRALSIAAKVGRFRGLGGNFISPPQVCCDGQHFIAADADSTWRIVADTFGVTLHRESGEKRKFDAHIDGIDSRGLVSLGPAKNSFPMLAAATSAARLPYAVAVTLPHAHRVYILANI